MKKIKKSMAAVALSLAMGLTTVGIPGEPVMEVHAEVTPDSSISLGDVSTVTADTAGSVLRIYGDGSTVYDVPISVTANCTVLLDNIENTADLTVETGVTANIVIRGNCSLRNIVAVGGVRTSVTISSEDGSGTLTTGNIAQAEAGQELADGYPGDPEMGVNVKIEDCTVICDNVGCGSDGLGWTYDQYQNGNERSYVSNAGSASDTVMIRNATLNARGSIACGGNGVVKTGSDRCVASDGGRAGNVTIANSYVTVGGNIALGGQGGDGCVTGTYNTVTAGEAMYPGIVTIVNNSVVDVYGNVATASDLADESHLFDRDGLSGGTVIVDKSSLTCKDIASGGCGVGKVYYRESSTNTTYYGTDGGQGGVLIAKNAVINCETACNGGEAGEYFDQTVGEEASYTGHPRDGSGGRIDATNSRITIADSACKRAMKWDGYDGNRSYHNRPSFIGGSLTGGKVYGADIITDVTAIFDCELMADYGVVNSEGTSAAKCIIDTSDEMAGENVFVTANTVSGSAILNASGQMVTYLATGTNEVKIAGTKTFVGSCLVDTNPVFNTFSLEEESIPETPDDGDEGIPGTGGEEIPGTGGEETPGTGGEETPPATEHEIMIPTAVTGSAVTVIVGEQTLNLESDENGNVQFTIGPDLTEFFVITESVKYRYPVTDGVPGDPSIVGPTAVLSGNVVLTEGDPLRLTVEAAASLDANTLSYEWYKDGNALAVSGSALDISEVSLSDAGSYFVVVTESNGQSVTTAAIEVSVVAGSGTGGSGGETGDSSGETAGGGSGNTSEEGTGGSGNTSEEGTGGSGEDNSGEGSGSTSGDSSGENSGGSTGTETGGNNGESGGDNAGDSSGSGAGSSSGGSATGGSSGGSSSGGSGVSAGGSSGGSAGGTSGGSTGGFGGGSAGGASGGSGGPSGGSTGGASGGSSSQSSSDQTVPDDPEKTEDPAGQVTAIQMKSNLNGIRLIPTSEKNTYKKYFSKTAKLTVTKEPNCTYYYKVVEKGRANSTVKWKKLTGNVIKVAASDTAKRIYIRAVDQNGTSVTRKTSGFFVDSKKPVVKGVKNKAVYTKPVKIRFSDNISVKAAMLNGKKVKNGRTVSKKGSYRLVVTDRAGNKKIIRFTINK